MLNDTISTNYERRKLTFNFVHRLLKKYASDQRNYNSKYYTKTNEYGASIGVIFFMIKKCLTLIFVTWRENDTIDTIDREKLGSIFKMISK